MSVHKFLRPALASPLRLGLQCATGKELHSAILRMQTQNKHQTRGNGLRCRRYSSAQPDQYRMVPVYEGSISKAARFMKLASVTSLIGASAAVPFYFTGDSEVPSAARMVLALTTVGMTGSSTLLAAWALKPYITTLHVVANEDDTSDSSIEVDADTPLLVETLTFLAKPYTRLVFPEQLASASVPMASWVVRQPSEALVAKADGILAQINKNRKKGDQIRLAQKGDKLYAFTQGQISALMAKIIAVSPAQEQ